MKMYNKKIIATCLLTAMASVGASQTETLLEGFEGPTACIANFSVSPQSANSIAPRGPSGNSNAASIVTTYKTQGNSSTYITNSWELAAPTAVNDQYERGTPNQLHWSVRAHWGAGTVVGKVYDSLKVDVYNPNGYAVDAAIILNDGGYKRHPWISLTPNAWTTLTWNFVADDNNLGPAVTSNSFAPLNQAATWKFYGIALHTTTQPANGTFNFYVDNLRGVSNQSDVTPPDAPKILKVEQGSAAGKLKVTWAANTEPDLAKYTVKVLDKASFGRALSNRMDFSVNTPTDFAKTETSGEVDVTAGEPVYVFMTATDTATPTANESAYEMPLGAVLPLDGSVPQDLVVFDMKRFNMSDATYGYQSMPAYFAKAWTTNGRTFVSAKAAAVMSDIQTLTPSLTGFTYWCNAIDGNTTATVMSDASCTKLGAYVAAGGKLMIGGAQYMKALTASDASPAALAFLADTLKVASVAEVATARFRVETTDLFTGAGPYYSGAGASAANMALAASVDSEGYGEFTDAAGAVSMGNATVRYGNKVMALGYSMEQVRDKNVSTDVVTDLAPADAARAAMMATLTSYLFPAPVADWSEF